MPVGTSGSLPKTASELPLVGLIGLLALVGAVAMRAARTA
jgi:LPXTG-motif cell wall-anchored protein